MNDPIRDSDNILFITGAGMSADCGVPTYRGKGGLYEQQEDSFALPAEVILTPETLAERPDLVWQHLAKIEQASRGVTPHPGHHFLAHLEKAKKRVWILTQNVDGLHQSAGSTQVIDIHGDYRKLSCTRCRYRCQVADYAHFSRLPPLCPECSAVLRPDVILFGEGLPFRQLHALETQLKIGFDLVVSIGTSSLFPYIQAPVFVARAAGKSTIEINPSTTEISRAFSLLLPLGAAAALNAIASINFN